LVQAKEKCRVGHFWVLIAPERHVLYAYSAKHDKKAVDRMLAGYSGYLVADAHAVYDHLYRGGDVIEVACWAHARRYFFKALESEPDRAREALALIGELFRIERQIAEAPTRKREVVRQRESKPVVEARSEYVPLAQALPLLLGADGPAAAHLRETYEKKLTTARALTQAAQLKKVATEREIQEARARQRFEAWNKQSSPARALARLGDSCTPMQLAEALVAESGATSPPVGWNP
jgi:hypothetical protein